MRALIRGKHQEIRPQPDPNETNYHLNGGLSMQKDSQSAGNNSSRKPGCGRCRLSPQHWADDTTGSILPRNCGWNSARYSDSMIGVPRWMKDGVSWGGRIKTPPPPNPRGVGPELGPLHPLPRGLTLAMGSWIRPLTSPTKRSDLSNGVLN